MALAPLSVGFQSLPPPPTIKLGPSGTDSQVGGFVYVLGSCRSLQWTLLWVWEFLPLTPQSPQVFSISGLRLYFPHAGALGHHPPPCCESSLPCCPSLPLLWVWMNVCSLSPWLSDFHTVRFSVSSSCFLFLNCCCPSFGCARRHSVSSYASILATSPRIVLIHKLNL